MARSHVVRTDYCTTVHGFELVDGEMVPRSYTYNRRWETEDTMARSVKADHPNFVPASWDEVKVEYSMSVEEFYRLASVTVIE